MSISKEKAQREPSKLYIDIYIWVNSALLLIKIYVQHEHESIEVISDPKA
jgi:hypothetical protein